MADFSTEWLDLREAVDSRSRAQQVAQSAMRWRQNQDIATLRVLDLACGTGANTRALLAALGGSQTWTLLDINHTVLAGICSRMCNWAAENALLISDQHESGLQISGSRFDARLRWQKLDLVSEFQQIDFAAFDLITASALLDLVSDSWLHRLLKYAVKKNNPCAFLFALTYDGTLNWTPYHPYDDKIRILFNQHQLSDKGFGAALGSQAISKLTDYCTANHYAFVSAKSPWIIKSGKLLHRLSQGHAKAAKIMAPEQGDEIEHWLASRLSQCVSQAIVGHIDVFFKV